MNVFLSHLMPALVVDVEHLDRVVGEFGVSPGAAELPVRAANHVDELLCAQAWLGVEGDQASLSQGLEQSNNISLNYSKISFIILGPGFNSKTVYKFLSNSHYFVRAYSKNY